MDDGSANFPSDLGRPYSSYDDWGNATDNRTLLATSFRNDQQLPAFNKDTGWGWGRDVTQLDYTRIRPVVTLKSSRHFIN